MSDEPRSFGFIHESNLFSFATFIKGQPRFLSYSLIWHWMLKNNWKVHIFFFKWSHGSSKTFLQGQVIIGFAILSLFVRVYSKGVLFLFFVFVFTFLCLCLFLFFQLFFWNFFNTGCILRSSQETPPRLFSSNSCPRRMPANTGGSFLPLKRSEKSRKVKSESEK